MDREAFSSGMWHGRYVVDVQQAGFGETKVNVVAGGTSRTPLKIVLTIAGVQEQVTVAASETSAQKSAKIKTATRSTKMRWIAFPSSIRTKSPPCRAFWIQTLLERMA
jgi:hypothetical protein